MKINLFFGFKNKQWQTFNEKGDRLVVTAVKAAPLSIVRIKNKDKNGYLSYQVALTSNKKNKLKEIRVAELEENLKPNDKINIKDVFKVGDVVKVTGKTIGKGFQGVVKRWGFAGGPSTHGQSDRQRSPGSIGMRSTPGRVWKGKKMAGHMGNATKTITGLKVFKIDEEKQEIWLAGLIPGKKGNLITIRKS
jgi:large subunit ribosomal protein L3